MTASSIILIVITILVTYKGNRDRSFFERYRFNVDQVLIYRQYYRLFTAGFLHVGWAHLIWNLIALFAFSSSIESWFGTGWFLLIYCASIIAGNLFALIVHRLHGDYSSVGASGGVTGIIFASLAVFPGMHVGLFFIPLSIPGWIFGIVFVVFTIYGIKGGRDSIGHESHLAGGLTGMLLGIIMHPEAVSENYITILLIGFPMIAFIAAVILKPELLIIGKRAGRSNGYLTVDDRYNASKLDRQKELDRILDKIATKGMRSLTKKEKELLKDHSRSIRP